MKKYLLASAVLFLLSVAPAFAFTIVQHKSAQLGIVSGSCTVNVSSTVAGDLLWGAVGSAPTVGIATTTYSATSSVAQTWIVIANNYSPAASASTSQSEFYDANASSGITAVTFTPTKGGTNDIACYVVEVSGVATSSPLDTFATSTWTTTSTPHTNVFTTTNANDIILTHNINEVNGTTQTAGGGSIALDIDNGQLSMDEFEIISTAGATSTFINIDALTGTVGNMLVAAAFKAAAVVNATNAISNTMASIVGIFNSNGILSSKQSLFIR